MELEIVDLSESNTPIGSITRTPRQHKGWQSVTFEGKRYQVFGGVRTAEFIDLANPLKTRFDKSAELRAKQAERNSAEIEASIKATGWPLPVKNWSK